MRILDEENNKATKNVLLLLTPIEAAELRDDLERTLSQKTVGNHSHINDNNYEHEITIAIYEDGKLDGFNERTKRLIADDE